jgi:hypothetical protein
VLGGLFAQLEKEKLQYAMQKAKEIEGGEVRDAYFEGLAEQHKSHSKFLVSKVRNKIWSSKLALASASRAHPTVGL